MSARSILTSVPVRVLALVLAIGAAFSVGAASAKKYQVTGKVLDVIDTMITVEKGDEKWEIGRSAETKADGKVKVGDKVTIYYRMTADSIEVK